MKASHHPLFHKILKQLKEHNIKDKTLLLAVSGGIDSISLLDLMTETSPILKLKLNIAHVHHGNTSSSYRNQSQIFTHSLAESLGLPFFSNTPSNRSKNSEGELRKIRYTYLQKWMKESHSNLLTLAHSSDDLLETRLMRLLRGTGKDGLQSMQFVKKPILRPLLFTEKKDIKSYALARKLQWIEDPSNTRTKTLRNWIRSKWLRDLEKKQKGFSKNLALSLEKLMQTAAQTEAPALLSSQGLDRKKMLELSLWDQKQWIAKYMRKSQLKNYSENHIQELLKYLKYKNKKIRLLGKTWIFTPSHIKIQNP